MHSISKCLKVPNALRFLVPYTTRAKVLEQHLLDNWIGLGQPNFTETAAECLEEVEDMVSHLQSITLPRCYINSELDYPISRHEVLVFFLMLQSRHMAMWHTSELKV